MASLRPTLPSRLAAAEFSFDHVPVTRYVPPDGRVDRLSFVRWADGPCDPSPIFHGSALHPTTTVVAWVTDRGGFVDPERVSLSPVLEWVLTPSVFDDLGALHREFHLGRHDVLVSGGTTIRLAPCRETLQRLVPALPNLEARIRAAVAPPR